MFRPASVSSIEQFTVGHNNTFNGNKTRLRHDRKKAYVIT